MAEIRCPMCGKLNPDDLDVCQHCQARLTPLIIDPEDRDVPLSEAGVPQRKEPDEQKDEEIPEWLRSMGEVNEDFDDEESFTEPADEDDWLGRLQSTDDRLQDTQAEETQGEDEEKPDLLSRLREGSEGAVESGSPFSSEDVGGEGEEGEYVPPFDEEIEDRDAPPDWLQRLQSATEEMDQQEEELPPDAQRGDLPSLESLLGEHGYTPETPEEPESPSRQYSEVDEPGIPEWLRDMDEDIPESFQRESQDQPFTQESPEEEIDQPVSELQEETTKESSGLLDRLLASEKLSDSGDQPLDDLKPDDEDAELPDWFSEGREEEITEPEPEPAEQIQEEPDEEITEENFPDWLAELDEDAGESEEASPDWLSEIGPPREIEGLAGDEGPVEIDTSWLTSLPDAGEFEESETDATPTGEPLDESTDAEPEIEDFLDEPEEGVSEEIEESIGEDIPDWLTELDSETGEAEIETGEGEEATPDWLSEIGSPSEIEDLTGDESPVSIDNSWLSSLPDISDLEDQEEEPEAPELVPDETTDADAEMEAFEDEEGFEEPIQEEEFPEWMADLETESEGESFEEIDEALEAGEMPDWLSEFESETEGEVPEEIKVPEEPSEDVVFSEWLSSIDIDAGELGEKDLEEQEDSEIPEWFSEVEPDRSEDQADEEEIPSIDTDWLKSLPDASEFDDQEDIPVFDEPLEEPLSEEVPDWLEDMGQPPTDQSRMEPETQDDEEELEELEALEDQKDQVPTVSFEGDEDLPIGDDLPDWLSAETLKAEKDEEFQPVDEEDLTPAEMPGWLAAMKPVDVTSSDDDLDTGEIENAGPLMGLRSVLPAEPDIAKVKKTVSQSIKLQVPEDQLNKAALLEEVLESEGKARKVQGETIVSTQQMMRVLIAVILVGAILLVASLSTQWVPLPDRNLIPMPAEVLDASRIVNQVGQSSPVLVAFEYEPGTVGEMTTAARPVLNNLMLRGANLALVSTSPTGPALADRFIVRTLAAQNYIGGTNYVNLGYIPGGASGLLGFAENPQLFTPFSFEGWNAWATMPVEEVESLEDFALLLVITDDPATARYWIEQVEPGIPNTPFIVISSAQATPLIRPYYQSQNPQVDGLVSGITGGLAYEQATVMGEDSIGRAYWDAFNAGLIIAALAILIGAVVNGFWHWKRNQPSAGVKEEGE